MLQFEKPKTDPSAFIKPATTVLSPYLKFGCLSVRVFHARLAQVRPKSGYCVDTYTYGLMSYMSLLYTIHQHQVSCHNLTQRPRLNRGKHCVPDMEYFRCTLLLHTSSKTLFEAPASTTQYSFCLQIERAHNKCSQPPQSLRGQLLWREFFYTVGAHTQNFQNMAGNPLCKQIDWDDNGEFYAAWDEARTGYPWIDAIMMQLRTQARPFLCA